MNVQLVAFSYCTSHQLKDDMRARCKMLLPAAVINVLCLHLVMSVTIIPPLITKQSEQDIFYKIGETVKIECEASGEPKPSYFWRRAEKSFSPEGNDDRIVQLKDSGTLIINRPEDKDEGIYQCFAFNGHGTAATVKFNLKMAKLDEFITSNAIIHTPQLGSPLTLSCQSPDSVPDAEIYWTYGDDGDLQPIIWDSRVTMDYEDRLYFTYVIPEDYRDGQAYQCVVYNSHMRMSVVGPPHYIKPQGASVTTSPMLKLWPTSRFDEQGLIGTDFKMKCIFSGNPAPIVVWKRKDGDPFNTRVLQGNSGGQELVIRDLHFEDAGTYLCDSYRDQESTRLEMSVNLNVNSPPIWKAKPKDFVIVENANAEFDCSAQGVPKPQVFWYVNGVPLEEALRLDKRLDGRFHHVKEDKIMLEKVTKLDSMVFQCNVTNIHGYLWAEAILGVLSEAPTILEYPKQTKVAEGQPFEITCKVTGKPDPIVTWSKNNQTLTGGRYTIRESGNLYADVAVLSDAGDFRCEARNVYGSVDAMGRLIVRRKTVVQWIPMDLEVQRGVNAKFTCSGTTDPEETSQMTTIWLKDGEPVDLGTRMFLNTQDHSLTISGSEQRDTGTYTCVISNGLDNDTASARLVVTDIPDAPYDVKIREECQTNKTMELEWIAGSFNNAPIEFFVVEYTTKVDPNRWVFATSVDYRKSSASIVLDAGMDYSFRVTSHNKIGHSNPSISSNRSCVTTSKTPKQNPRNVRAIGDKPGMLHIEWTPVPPELQGGKNFTYIITILRVGDPDNNVYTQKITDWRVSEYLYPATGSSYTRYKITVKSRNSDGDCLEPTPTIYGYSSEGAPLVWPTNLNVEQIQSDRALFSWQFDRNEIGKIDSKIRGEFRGFKIQVWEQNRQAETIREFDVSPELSLTNSTSNTFSAVMNNLIPNTRLNARVALLNNFFVSKPSDIIAFVTPPGLPGPVELLRDLNIGDNHVNLQWLSPLDNRGDVIGYDIGYQEVRGLRVGEMQDRLPQIDDPYATTAMLSGLLPNTKYRIHIWARTAVGRGEVFFIERTTAKPGVPLIPRFTIASVGSDFINVTWWRDAYQNSGSVVYIQYKKEDGAEWFSTTPDVSRDWVKLSYLQPGFKYNIRIVVTNGETIRLSQIEDVTTNGDAKAYDVVANLGWFMAMIFSLLFEISLFIIFVICYRRGFRFKTGQQEIRTFRNGSETYTGTHYKTDEIPQVSKDFDPEPRGYANNMYKHGYDDDYEDDQDGFDSNEDNYKRYAQLQEGEGYQNLERESANVGPGGNDYEEYNVDGTRNLTYNKTDQADDISYTPSSSNYNSDTEGRGRFSEVSRREDRRMRTTREARPTDRRHPDSTNRRGRKVRESHENPSVARHQISREDGQNSSQGSRYEDDHHYSGDDRQINYHHHRRDYHPDERYVSSDDYDSHRDDDNEHDYRHGHIKHNHDHEDVVDEFRRYNTAGPIQDNLRENLQRQSPTLV